MVKYLEDYEESVKNLQFRGVTENKKGYPVVNFTVNDGERMRFQTAKPDEGYTRAPFGISIYVEKTASQSERELKEKAARKNLDLVIKNARRLAIIRTLEENVIQAAINNKATWFKKPMTDDQVRQMFSSCIHENDQYDTHIRTHVNVDMASKNPVKIGKMVIEADGTKVIEVEQNAQGKQIPKSYNPSEAKKSDGFDCIAMCDCNSVYFQQKGFGLTFTTTDFIIVEQKTNGDLPFDLGADKVVAAETNAETNNSQGDQNLSGNDLKANDSQDNASKNSSGNDLKGDDSQDNVSKKSSESVSKDLSNSAVEESAKIDSEFEGYDNSGSVLFDECFAAEPNSKRTKPN